MLRPFGLKMNSETDRRSGNERFKRKTPDTFKFAPNRIIKLPPTGNITKGTDYPKPRSGHRVVYRNGNIFAFGGYAALSEKGVLRHMLYNELWKYNYATKTWKLLETSGKMPDTLASQCAFLINNVMLVFGGTGVPFGETVSDATYACNLDTLEWTTLETTGTPPKAQYGQAMSVHENKMYIVGGTNGFTYCMDVHCLDLKTKVWEKLVSEPTPGLVSWDPIPRYRHEIAIHDDQIFVFGGGTSDDSYEMKEIPVFNLKTHKWNCVKTSVSSPSQGPALEHPGKRRCHGCVQLETDVYICGGLDGELNALEDDEDSSVMYSDVWKFNLESLQWVRLPPSLPKPLYFHSTAVSKSGQMFVFGGVNSKRNTRTRELLALWVRVPSLAEMSWNAFLRYAPDPAALGARALHRLGVPHRFIRETDLEEGPAPAPRCCQRTA